MVGSQACVPRAVPKVVSQGLVLRLKMEEDLKMEDNFYFLDAYASQGLGMSVTQSVTHMYLASESQFL
jgi:hypothetical protein